MQNSSGIKLDLGTFLITGYIGSLFTNILPLSCKKIFKCFVFLFRIFFVVFLISSMKTFGLNCMDSYPRLQVYMFTLIMAHESWKVVKGREKKKKEEDLDQTTLWLPSLTACLCTHTQSKIFRIFLFEIRLSNFGIKVVWYELM